MNRQPQTAAPLLDGVPDGGGNWIARAGPDGGIHGDIDGDIDGGIRAPEAEHHRPLKILILALNSAPDLVGAGKATGEMAAWLAGRGHRVEVIAAPPYYPGWQVAEGYSAAGYRRELQDRVSVVRCPTYVPRRPTGLRRVLHHLSFAISSLPAVVGRALAGRPDVVLTVAPSILAAPNAWLAARLSGAAAWLHVQDLELDAAVELGLLGPRRRHGWAAALETRLLRRFDRVTTIGPGMAARLADKGVDPMHLGVLANWVDCGAIRPLPAREVSRSAFGLPAEAFVALYSGSLGEKQGLDVLIDAAERLVHRRDLHIAVFGDGPARRRLLDAAAQLPNLTVGPLVPPARLNDLLNCADAHVLPQAAGIDDLVLPSKLTHMLASGRPVIAAAPGDGQLADLIEDCGLRLDANAGAGFAWAIDRLAGDPVLCRSLGRSARERAVERLDRNSVLARLERALHDAHAPVAARART